VITSRYEVVDLNLLVDDVVGELEVKIDEKKATIENLGLPCLNVIRFQFHQLFLNLLSNALKFSKPGVNSHIVIKCDRVDASQVPGLEGNQTAPVHHITISDNGIGFDSHNADKVFEMFKRLHTRTQYEGTGIGLAICKKIVENHGGIIVAEGKIGEGAAFHVYLPEKPNE
jgi:signal transduction histidine kinase